jgi:hypothetical protein
VPVLGLGQVCVGLDRRALPEGVGERAQVESGSADDNREPATKDAIRDRRFRIRSEPPRGICLGRVEEIDEVILVGGSTRIPSVIDLVRKYYGDAQGVCKVDALYGVEWAYVDHFFYDFYVYQYATSIVASTTLAADVRAETTARKPSTKVRDAYLAMLAAGGSKYPIDLLKDAGVDMTTSAPFTAAMREMNGVMDEMEKLLK